jgi:hypothetical protein
MNPFRLLRGAAFGPEHIAEITEAYLRVIDTLGVADEASKELVAKVILNLATEKDVLDANLLRQDAPCARGPSELRPPPEGYRPWAPASRCRGALRRATRVSHRLRGSGWANRPAKQARSFSPSLSAQQRAALLVGRTVGSPLLFPGAQPAIADPIDDRNSVFPREAETNESVELPREERTRLKNDRQPWGARGNRSGVT